jgi:hypothetical protein
MASPAICFRDETVENGSFQVKDMWPNRSQANPVVDPAPQGPRYIRQPENELVGVTNGIVDVKAVGLSAYLLANTDNGAGAALTPAQAFVASVTLLARMRAGDSLLLANINSAVDDASGNGGAEAVDAGNGLTASGSVGDVLAIMGGARFSLAAGYEFEGNGAFVPAVNSDLFDSGKYQRINEDDSSFWISVEQGDLFKAKNYRIDQSTGANLPPIVVVYDGLGAVI